MWIPRTRLETLATSMGLRLKNGEPKSELFARIEERAAMLGDMLKPANGSLLMAIGGANIVRDALDRQASKEPEAG